jgi:hypothetical protein
MKEKVGLAIVGFFSIALVVFFAIGKIPLEVFAPIITGALVWVFKDIEQRRWLKILRNQGVLR